MVPLHECTQIGKKMRRKKISTDISTNGSCFSMFSMRFLSIRRTVNLIALLEQQQQQQQKLEEKYISICTIFRSRLRCEWNETN